MTTVPVKRRASRTISTMMMTAKGRKTVKAPRKRMQKATAAMPLRNSDGDAVAEVVVVADAVDAPEPRQVKQVARRLPRNSRIPNADR
jgi:hypothetical protein